MATIKQTNQSRRHVRAAALDHSESVQSLRKLKKETVTVARHFTDFLKRSNAVDIASAMLLSNSVAAIVGSIVNDILMPFIGALFRTNIKNLVLTIGTTHIAYGSFIQSIFHFLLIAGVFFLVLRTVSKMRKAIEKIEDSIDK